MSTVSSAQAADLGGDCCADLEERIAELEATTARKGNRKVSLTISGHINQMLLVWDDGVERNAYVVDNSNSASRLRFVGEAKISPDWSAGYLLEIEAISASSSAVSQNDDEVLSNGPINIRHSHWWIKSKQFGKLALGQNSPATDDIILSDAEGSSPGGWSDFSLFGGGMFLREKNGTLITSTTMREFAPTLDTSRRNVIRYDTPSFGGFKVVTAWGEDDFWDVGLWAEGKIGEQFEYEAGIGFARASCVTTPGDGCERISGEADYQDVKGSASFVHVPTGLYLDGAFVHREFDNPARPDFDYFYVRPGIIFKKLLPVGKSVFYGEYAHAEDGITGLTNEADLDLVTSSELTGWGLGVTQHVDNAAMEIYLLYRNLEMDASGVEAAVATKRDFENLQLGVFGARIKF